MLSLFLHDESGRIVEASQHACERLGYEREELVGKTPMVFDVDLTRERLEELYSDKSAGVTMEFNARFCRKGGAVFPVVVESRWFQVDENRFAVSLVRDLSGRVDAEAALKDSEERYRAFVDHCADALFLQEWDGRVVDVNRQACESLGYERAELIGVRPAAFDPIVGAKLPDDLSARLENDETVDFDTMHRRKNGTTFPVEVRLRPFWIRGKRQILSLAHDITERKAAEETNARLAAIIESSDDGVYSVTLDGIVTSWNAAAQRLYGYTADEMIGQPVARIVSADRVDEAMGLIESVKNGRSIAQFETVRLRKNGTSVEVALNISPIKDSQGQLVGVSTIARDIADRKLAEETIRQIVDVTTPKTGPDYFHALVTQLSQICRVEYAFVAGVDPADENAARTIAVSLRGRMLENFSYTLSGTPCENVIGQSYCYYAHRVQSEFPNDPLLSEMGIDSYMGIPLFSSTGLPLGLIVLLHNLPFTHPERAKAILQVVAARAGAELERVRTQAALDQMRVEFEFLAEAFPSLVYRTDRQGKCVAVNDARWMDLTGRESDAWKRDGWRLALHPGDRGRVIERWEHTIAQGAVWVSEYRFLRPDDGITWVLDQAVPLRDHLGNFDGYFGACIDITHIKQTEQALLRTQYSLDHAAISIFWIGKDGDIRYANDMASQMLGLSREELARMSVLDLPPRHTPDSWKAHFDKARQQGCLRDERTISLKDGSTIPLDVTTNFVRFGDEEFLFAFVRDITDQKLAEDRVERQNAELLHVTRLSTMGQMVATLSHELAQPLSTLSNYVDICAMHLDEATDRDAFLVNNIHEMANQVARAGTILHRVRDFVRKTAPKLSLCGLDSVLNDSLAIMASDYRRHGVRVCREFADQAIMVRIDPTQIQQVVVNLLTNARDAMADVDVADRTVNIRLFEENGEAAIEVVDCGAGFSADVQHRLFEPFVTSKDTGMGIGLSICRTIIESHRGRILAEQNAEHGATFRVYLPIQCEN
jgi:PAS domain S-box-containing protein